METLDLRRELRHLYSPKPGRFELVTVPELSYLAIEGQLEPGSTGPGSSPGFASATGALYGLAYTLRFGLKKRAANPVDFPVMPLEGQWWLSGGEFDLASPDNWEYRLLIAVPNVIDATEVAAALAELRRKRGEDADFERLELVRFAEGDAVQVLHVGPYATEPDTLAGLPGFLAEHGLVDLVGTAGGRHHEIYLGDPRRTDPAKLKTILRHPVAAR